MSTILTRKGADYSLNARAFVPPVSNGLIGWWYLGGMAGDDAPTALARTIKNLAPGSTQAMSLILSPTIATGYVQVDGTNYLNTTISETLDFTVLVLALPQAVSGGIATWVGTGTDKTMMSSSSPLTSFSGFTPRDAGGGTHAQFNCGTVAVGAGFTSLHVLSYKIASATGVPGIRDLTTGQSAGTTITGGARVLCNGTPTLRAGGVPAFVGAIRLGFLAVYNRSISDAEGDSIRTFVAKYRLAKYGDVV